MANITPRFITNFLSQSTQPFNMAIPWRINNQDGMFSMHYNREKAMKDNLSMWAKTNWGERLGRFRYGLDAKRYLFSPTIVVKEALKTNTFEQFSKFFKNLKIDKLEILTWEDNNNIPENSLIYKLETSFKDNEQTKIRIEEEITL